MRGDPFYESSPSKRAADEVDRQLLERQKRASRTVVGFYLLTVVPYLASWVAGLWPGSPPRAFAVSVALAIACAMATGIVTLKNWSLLSGEMRLFGLAPWAFFALTTFPWLVMAILL